MEDAERMVARGACMTAFASLRIPRAPGFVERALVTARHSAVTLRWLPEHAHQKRVLPQPYPMRVAEPRNRGSQWLAKLLKSRMFIPRPLTDWAYSQFVPQNVGRLGQA